MKNANADLTPTQRAELETLAALPEEQINTRDIPEPRDWSGAKRGRFFRPLKQQLTLRLDADLIAWFKDLYAEWRGLPDPHQPRPARIHRATRSGVTAGEVDAAGRPQPCRDARRELIKRSPMPCRAPARPAGCGTRPGHWAGQPACSIAGGSTARASLVEGRASCACTAICVRRLGAGRKGRELPAGRLAVLARGDHLERTENDQGVMTTTTSQPSRATAERLSPRTDGPRPCRPARQAAAPTRCRRNPARDPPRSNFSRAGRIRPFARRESGSAARPGVHSTHARFHQSQAGTLERRHRRVMTLMRHG